MFILNKESQMYLVPEQLTAWNKANLEAAVRFAGIALEGAEINRDRNLRLQYLAGLGYNEFLGTPIRNEILSYRTFPSDLFKGSPASIDYLRELIIGP